ncbi:MAG TPA: glycoside hydrolase family 36 N-terminal domain-containing protein, partial [Chloroflexota bacterium]
MAVSRSQLDGRRAWILATAHTSMVLCLGDDDTLYLPHWGAAGGTEIAADYLPHIPLNRPSEATFLDGQPLAYPIYGSPTFKEPCLVVATENGARGSRLAFVEDHLADERLELTFRDALLDLRLILHFDVHPPLDVIARSAELINDGQQMLFLERALSAALALPPDEYDVVSLHGQWGREFELQQQPLLPGRLTNGSTRGLSSHEAHPWFAIRPRGEHDEHTGRAWCASLAWSGNWLTVFDVERNDALNIVAGIQPFDFTWRLEPGGTFS